MKSFGVPLPFKRFAGRSKITITFIVAIAVALTALLITGFIYREQKQQLESTQYRLKGIANRDAANVNFFDSLDTFTYGTGFSKELIKQAFTNAETGHTGKVVLEWDYGKRIMNYPNFEKTIGQKPLTDSLRSADEAINVKQES